MACPAVLTGTQFLSSVTNHIDCQSRAIGSYGYGALATPGSAAFTVTTGLLAIFIAMHGIWLMFDGEGYSRRLVRDVVKIGLVLTLATSWPAWRVIGYDLVLNGPIEVARAIGDASGTTSEGRDGLSQAQFLDDAMVVMTAYGTGRLSGGGIAQGNEPGDSFRGIALADQSAYGWGRTAFLIGAIVPFGIARLGAGLLLALAPLVAGLYFFGGTSGIFVGWTRALTFCGLASLAQYLTQAVEIDIAQPWVLGVVADRQADILTPSAPTELLVMSLSFAIISLGLLLVIARLAFYPSAVLSLISERRSAQSLLASRAGELGHDRSKTTEKTRAQLIAEGVSGSMRREETYRRRVASGAAGDGKSSSIGISRSGECIEGARGREGEGVAPSRNFRRTSSSATQRDLR